MDETLAILGGTPAVPHQCRKVPILADATVEALHRAADRAQYDWSYLSGLAGGGTIQELEEGFASAVGVRYALALSSCTAALFTALVACGVKEGDEVIVPAYTWGQSAAPILHVGATPVFADIDPDSYTLSVGSLEHAITERTRAVIVVHLFGHPANMPAIAGLCRHRGLRLIEDAAHSLGASIDGKPVGAWGDAACFSLGRGKPVTGGEGGVLCTSRARIFENAVSLTQHPVRQHYELGRRLAGGGGEFNYNLRIHPLAAVVATSELHGWEARQSGRAVFWQALNLELNESGILRPPACPSGTRHAYYRYCPTYQPAEEWRWLSRESFVTALAAEGVPISADPIGVPLHQRRLPGGRSFGRRQRLPVCEERCRRTGLALESSITEGRGEETVEQIGHAVRKICAQVHLLRELTTTHGLAR